MKNDIKKIINNSITNNRLNHCFLLKSNQKIIFDKYIVEIINLITNYSLISLEKEQLPLNIIYLDYYDENKIGKEMILQTFNNATVNTSKDKKIIIFQNIENVSLQALNSILKTIKEPNNKTIFILTTNNINKVLPTVRSRAFIININEEIENEELVEFLIKNNNLNNEKALFYSEISQNKEEIIYCLNNEIESILEEFYNVIKNTKKSFIKIYLFLEKYTKKESFTIFIFLIKIIKYALKIVIFEKKPLFLNENLKKVILRIKEINNINNIYELINDFLNKSNNKNLNPFLQAESFLIKLMEMWNV
ncbi:AAA family ATPase [Mycoplasmopsis meleagridis]|uniref:AAA family ATPase n=1 Tax=Mycoplasmopsis meleagridis TaxID=29561 RepID=UPI003A86C2E9